MYRKASSAAALVLMGLLFAGLITPLSYAMAETASIISFPKEEAERPELEGLLQVHFLNVFGADCILIRVDNHALMIDSGNERTAKRVLDYLERIGVERLDIAFISHPHDDHIGGYTEIFRSMPVGEVYMANRYETYVDEYTQRLEKIVQAQQIPWRIVHSDTVIQLGSATLTFLQPQADSLSVNNRSMAAKLQYGDRSALFMADIEGLGQRALVEDYGQSSVLEADLLKMPHHGLTLLDPELEACIQPKVAVFSNILDDIEAAMARSHRHGIHPLCTARGTIVAVTNGEHWWIWQTPTTAP